MVSKVNLSAFTYMTNKKFTCISVTSQNFFCDRNKSSFDVSFKVEINLYLKDCFGNSCTISEVGVGDGAQQKTVA